MKRIVLMVVMLIVSAATTLVKAAEPQYHRFLKPQYHNQLSDAEYRSALKGLFEGNKEIQSKYWNPIPTCSYDQMRYIYAQHLMKVYRSPELPNTEEMVTLVDISKTVAIPNKVQTSGIVRGTANLEYFTRDALANETGLEQGGVIWSIGSCGNPGNIGAPQQVIPVRNPKQTPIREEFDRPMMRTEFASNREGGWDNNPSRSSNDIRITTATPSGNNSGGMSNEMMMMWMMSQQNQQRNYQPSEVTVKSKPNFWEVAAGATGILNLGLNIWERLDNRNNNNVNYQQYYGGNNTVRPNNPSWQHPNRPDRPNYPQNPTTPPWQGGSGYYPNPFYGNNSNPNGSGLGAGTGGGTIWDNGNNNGGYQYRLPVGRAW